MYFGSTLEACFGEVLARKRPDPTLARLVEEQWRGHQFMEIGAVPRDWRDRRSVVKVRLPTRATYDDLDLAGVDVVYLDADHPDSHGFLRQRLALGLAALDHDDLNIGIVRGRDRRVTRLISSWAWSQTPDEGLLFGGIRYTSKLDSTWECWAVFDDMPLQVLDTRPIVATMPELQTVANRYGLTVH